MSISIMNGYVYSDKQRIKTYLLMHIGLVLSIVHCTIKHDL